MIDVAVYLIRKNEDAMASRYDGDFSQLSRGVADTSGVVGIVENQETRALAGGFADTSAVRIQCLGPQFPSIRLLGLEPVMISPQHPCLRHVRNPRGIRHEKVGRICQLRDKH